MQTLLQSLILDVIIKYIFVGLCDVYWLMFSLSESGCEFKQQINKTQPETHWITSRNNINKLSDTFI